uniref:Plectin/eS10 N-terminal domain-containing protein n=1 Tax=Chromera velia CCMP2878 TaxID=1169474 RepID=A0A0G4HXZ5_9ALVE|eukprot:Cvel_1506.t1-p1 / transcript=Cvel_1506.t1 / gene=Cvel_1506 / organism=Chromera_velia_CCMP2878 / gene_product=40S ribosomal protein S10, putative / transcript_product=40S ribosomal protein S10, putative / location=Cvel_scaffold53:15937-16434(-) / protein_length=137 / sequence_SO=supercontig / SO=protein_coding / is_pseudo=false
MSVYSQPGMAYSLIPKRNRKAIFEHLFKEGVIVVKKDPTEVKHKELDMPNLHVRMALRSLKSKNYVDEKFNWRHHYYTLTNDGIEYLREYLHLPPQVFPATLTKKSGPSRPGGDRPRRDGEGYRGGFGRGRRAEPQE